MQYLRTNTATRVTVGPFFDRTDGVVSETALDVTNCKITLIVDTGGVPTLVLDTFATASGGSNDMVHITGDDAGYYDLELAAADVNYLGRAKLAITDEETHCPVFHEFMIVPAMIYDSMILGTDRLDTNVTHVADTAQTAKDIGAAVPAAAAGASGGLLISGSNSGTTTLAALTVTGATTFTGAITGSNASNNLRINGAAPGASGGLLISGSNSGTTTLGALTVTGATTFTGAITGSNASNNLRINGVAPGAAGGVFIAGTNAATTVTTSFTTTFTGNLTGSVASVTGAVGSVTGAVGSVTGNVGGNVTGSIGSVASGGITATSIAADAIGASELAADAVAEIQSGLATASALATAQADLDTITGSDGVTLATTQALYAPAKAGDSMALVNDAITSAKFDESTAFPLASADSGSTAVARTGADADTLETLSDEIASAASTTNGIAQAIGSLYLVNSTTIGSTGNDTTHIHVPGLTYADDELNDYLLVILDASSGERHARWIEDWVLSTELVTVATLPFTPQSATDIVWVSSISRNVVATVDTAAIADAVWDEATAGHTTSGTFGEQVKTDIDAILADTDVIGATGAGLTSLATASALATAQADLDTLTGTDGVTLATSQPNYAPATSAALATAQTDLDTITGSDGATLATTQGNYAPAKAGDSMALVNDAITSAKFDESTAFPVTSADSGSTAIARTGADGDTLETLSDQLDIAGGTNPFVVASGTIGSTGNDTTHLHLTGLTYGDDELNDYLINIYDNSTGEYHSRWILDWADTGDLATVAALPFTPEDAVDTYTVLAVRQDVSGGSGLDAAGVRAAIGLASANLDTQLGDLPTAVENRAEMDSNSTQLTAIVADTNELQTNQGNWLTATGFSTHSAADVRTEMDANSTKLASILDDTDLIDDATSGLAKIATDVAAVLVDTSTTLQGELDGIQADTEDIQSRLPAALTAGGNIKADALAISGSTDAADNAEIVFDTDFDTNYTPVNKGWATYPAGYYDQVEASNQQFPDGFAGLTSGSIATAVWAAGTRTLTSFGTLVSDVATAVWAAATRTLSAFGFTVDTNANATETAILADTNELQTNQGNWLTATGFAVPGDEMDIVDAPNATAVTAIQSGLASQSSINALNDLSAAEVNAEVDTALADYDGPTRTEATADKDEILADIATSDGKIDAVQAKTDSLTFTNAGEVDSNIKSVNDVAVGGTGTSGDEWGPA